MFLVPDPVHSGGLRVKILDFGIAKLRPEQSVGGASVTRAGTTMGSPAYMAPEQCYELGLVTDRADVYALGIILYELIAGRPPFIADMPAEVLVMQAKMSPPPLQQLAPTVPRAVEALVERMMQKKAETRPSMAEVLAALTQLQTETPRQGPGTLAQPAAGKSLRIPTVALALVTVTCLLAAGLLLRQLQRRPVETPRNVTPPPTSVTTPPATAVQPAPVRCEVSSDPSGVQILDAVTERLLGTTPTTLNLERNAQPLKVVLRKAGYQERLVSLDRTRDVVRSESLLPLPRKPRPVGGSGTASPSTSPGPSTNPARTKPGKDELLAPSL